MEQRTFRELLELYQGMYGLGEDVKVLKPTKPKAGESLTATGKASVAPGSYQRAAGGMSIGSGSSKSKVNANDPNADTKRAKRQLTQAQKDRRDEARRRREEGEDKYSKAIRDVQNEGTEEHKYDSDRSKWYAWNKGERKKAAVRRKEEKRTKLDNILRDIRDN